MNLIIAGAVIIHTPKDYKVNINCFYFNIKKINTLCLFLAYYKYKTLF